MTDNRNRSIAFVRSSFRKYNGNLGSANSVQYMFDRLGSITVEKSKIDEDKLTEFVIESGAEDINTDNPELFQIITATSNFDSVRSFLEDREVPMVNAGLMWNPQTRIVIEYNKKAEQVIKLILSLIHI